MSSLELSLDCLFSMLFSPTGRGELWAVRNRGKYARYFRRVFSIVFLRRIGLLDYFFHRNHRKSVFFHIYHVISFCQIFFLITIAKRYFLTIKYDTESVGPQRSGTLTQKDAEQDFPQL